jgi:hypothetical protein
MKKLIAALALFVGFTANANLISVEVSDNAVPVGDTFQVTISANMLEDFDALSFELEFDPALEYQGSSYSDLDYTGGVFASPQLYGFAFTFLDFFAAAPAGNYVLAQFDLKATAETYSGFNVVNAIAGLFDFQTLSVNDVEVQANSQSPSVAVSTPATLGLFGMAALALFGLRRKA